MSDLGDFLLSHLLAYLIDLATGERSAAITATRVQKIKESLKNEEGLRKALASTYSIRDEIRNACSELARNRGRLGLTDREKPLWRLLSDAVFQADLAEWLMAGDLEEGDAVKNRLLETMQNALIKSGAKPEQIAFLKSGYFEAVEKAVFAHPVLAHWRHQMNLVYLREQVAILKQRAEEASGVYSLQKQRVALGRYCATSLAAWDIVDLSNLPRGDVHTPKESLLLRQFYVPLGVEVEAVPRAEDEDATLDRLEQYRKARRQSEAGYLLAGERYRSARENSRVAVGERLGVSQRLVVLGDPGGGKTTMLRWMATAYLLRHQGDDAFNQIPDAGTLPNQPWIPVLIRCRDLGEIDLCRCFNDFLTQHLNKTTLRPEDADIMRAVILDRIGKGEVLILVDGLDEISDSHVRMMFCKELERTAARYPRAAIVVTSRIVGYRDMPYRMGSAFEHVGIAELNLEDKELFAQRWVNITAQDQPATEKAKRANELLEALHSNDRIERLTGNPMLLTTLALVRHRLGKLPKKRTKLYAEAVSVLLNWNPEAYQTIDEDEAIPQLEYLAYGMCRRGVQQLTEDKIIELLNNARTEHPNIRDIRNREPRAFLALLEARSSILIKSGSIWRKNKEKPVWEFRHLTFQEYLAARALLNGHYPAQDKTISLVEHVALLAGTVPMDEGMELPESWHETLRLLVASCRDDNAVVDVDEIVFAILNPLNEEDGVKTSRPRSILAALCLAEEPDVAEKTSKAVFSAFAKCLDSRDDAFNEFSRGPMIRAVEEVARTVWADWLLLSLLIEWRSRSAAMREPVGNMIGYLRWLQWKRAGQAFPSLMFSFERALHERDYELAIIETLGLMMAAWESHDEIPGAPRDYLLDFATVDKLAANAAVSAMWYFAGGRFFDEDSEGWGWYPSGHAVDLLLELQCRLPKRELKTHETIIALLGMGKDSRAIESFVRTLDWSTPRIRLASVEALSWFSAEQVVEPLLTKLDDPDRFVRRAVVGTLGHLRSKQALLPLLAKLDDPDPEVRQAVVRALNRLNDKQAFLPLLAKLDDTDPSVREEVADALASLGNKKAVAPLLAHLNDTEADVRAAIATALGWLGSKQAVLPLLAKLDDPENDVRKAVARALGRLGDKRAVAPLLPKLDDSDPYFRQAVTETLGWLHGKQAVAPLMAKLNDPEADVRSDVARALGRLGDKQAVAPLLAKLDDTESEVRTAIAAALGWLGHRQAVLPLVAKLDDPDWYVGRTAARALGSLGDKRAVSPLAAKLGDAEPRLGIEAAEALIALGDSRGFAARSQFLNSGDADIRQAAMQSYSNRLSISDSQLLYRLNGDGCVDPMEAITEEHVADASHRYTMTPEQIRSRYEAIAVDLGLKLSWKD